MTSTDAASNSVWPEIVECAEMQQTLNARKQIRFNFNYAENRSLMSGG